MTIKELAKEKGISTQAVYQKLKAAGIQISSIKQENAQDLTPEGLEQINQLFTKGIEKNGQENGDFIDKLKSLQLENERLKDEKALLKFQVDELKAMIDELRADRDRWAAQAESAQQTAQQAQALNLAAIQALPAPKEKAKWWQRFSRKE